MFIIREDCAFTVFSKMTQIICCLLSSYYYAWLSCFGFTVNDPLSHFWIHIFFEGIFLIAIGLNFITEYSNLGPDGETKPVRDLGKIASNYMKGDFWPEFIVWIPLYAMIWDLHEYSKLINIIKLYRIKKGYEVFDVAKILDACKEVNQ